MGTQKQVIQIDAQINTHLGNLNDTVTKLKKGISDGVTKMDLSKGTGKALSGYIRQFKDEYDEFQKYIKTDGAGNSFVDFDDSGKAIASGKHLLKVFEDIQQVMHGINSKDAAGFDKLFPQGKIGDADDLLKSLEKVEPKLKELQEKQALRITLTGDITSIEARLTELKAELAEDSKLQIDVSGATEELEKATQQVEDLQKKLQESLQTKIGNVQGDLTKAQADKAKKEEQLRANKAAMDQTGIYFNSSGKMEYQGMSKGQWENATKKRSPEQREIAKNAFEQYERIAAESASIEAELAQMDAKIATTTKSLTDLIALAEKVNSPEGMASVEGGELAAAGVDTKQVEDVTAALERQTKAQLDLNKAKAQQTVQTSKQEQVETLTAELETKKKQIEQLGDAIAKLSEKANLSQLSEKLKDLGFDEVTEDSLKSEDGIKKIKEALSSMSGERLEKVKTELKEMGIIAEDTNGDIKLAAGALQKFDDNRGTLTRTQQDMESLKNRMLDFFSITNTVQLFKRAVTQAFNSVKELDAVMTQTAVVTDFSVGDMWDKLPEYTAKANSLGASVASLYEATTLYYQQGLDTNAAMGVGVETMKMARIAGMDAAAATEAMTAALRGFNMEVNELNATRVNDVYSELAAITAADTEQIATAMGKTASIAASANMEFETTAALLAQIIETTQEAPETAGTAMKTIIARFTEVKSLFSQGQLAGEDTEGEAIDINKIDTALKSVGISLKDFLNGQKGIDDIFLELASKWDTLDLATQRYIATTAAGSRQQSRFIAMMSDYGRTMELVSAANNSAGASQRQFDKTQESLEAKLQKLKNAWQEFTMNIMNSDVIKFGVDALIKILDTVNSLINALSGGNGLVKGVLSLGAALGALKLGNFALSGSLKFLGEKTFFGQILPSLKSAEKTTLSSGEVKQNVISGIRQGLQTIISAGRQFRELVLGAATGAAEIENTGAVQENVTENVGAVQASKIEVAGAVQETTIENAGAGVSGAGPLPLLKTIAPYFWGAAAAVAAIAAIAIIYKTVDHYTESLEEKKARLEKEISQAEEDQRIAQSQVDDTKTQRSNLSKLEGEFKNLTKGTTAWKEQLVKTNEEVMRLLELHPELQASVGTYGQLTITSESFDALIEKQQEQVRAAQANRSLAQLDLAKTTFEEGLLDYKTKINEINLQDIRLSSDGVNTTGFITGAGMSGNTVQVSAVGTGAGMSGNKQLQAYTTTTAVWADKISDTDMASYLAAFAEAGISGKNGIDEQEKSLMTSILNKMGYNETATGLSTKDLVNSIASLGGNFDKLGIAALNASVKMEQAAKGFFSSVASGANTDIKDEAVTNYLYSLYGGASGLQEEQERREKALLESGHTDEYLLKTYADLTGKYYKGGKVYSDESMNDAVDVDRYAAASVIVDYEIQQEASQKMSELNLNTSDQKNLFERVYGEGIGLTDSEIEYYSNDRTVSELYKDLYGTELNIEDAEAMKRYRSLWEQLELNKTKRADLSADVGEYINKYSDDIFFGLGNANNLRTFITNGGIQWNFGTAFGDNFERLISSAMQSVEASGSEGLMNQIFDSLTYKDVYRTKDRKQFTPEQFEEVSNWVSEIDFSNPIQAAEDFNEALNSDSEAIRTFAGEILEANDSFFSFGSQMRYLASTSEFSSIKKEVQEIVDKSGELTGLDVAKLADEYELFGQMMENNSASVAGMAKVLSELGENGSLKMHQLTDAVMAAASGFDSLDGVVSEALYSIKNFDPGLNETDATDFASKAYKTLTENQEKGYWGNSQSDRYLDYFFGPDWDKKDGKVLTGQEYKDRQVTLTNLIGEGDAGYEKAWTNLVQGKDIEGNIIEGFDLSQINNMNSEQIVDFLKENMNISEEYARLMLAYKKNTSKDFATILQSADYEEGIEKAKEEVVKKGNIIDESEIQAIADLYGKDFEEVRKEFEDNGALISNFYDEDGILKDGKKILQQLNGLFLQNQEYGPGGKKGLIDSYLSGEEFDLTSFKQSEYYQSLPEEAKAQIVNEIATQLQEKFGTAKFKDVSSSGTDITVEVEEGETYQEKKNQEDELARATATGKAIGAAIVENAGEIKITYPEGEVFEFTGDMVNDEELVEKLETLISNGNYNVTISGSISQEMIDALDQVNPGIKQKLLSAGITIASFAKGINNSPTAYDALVSEEGPELIQRADGTAYLSGLNGPEITKIHRGDTVYTAEETRKIFRNQNNKKSTMPRFSEGLDDVLANEHGGSGSGSGSGSGVTVGKLDATEILTSLDKLYNLLAQIEETTRQREHLERRYEYLIKDTNAGIKDVVKNSREQLAVLEAEKELQETLIKDRQVEIEAYAAQNAGYAQYAGVETNAYGDQVMRIDWDAINAISNDDERKKVEEYVSKLEGWLDELTDAEKALWDIEDAVEEINERGKEEYLDFESQIKDALLAQYQEEIDQLSAIDEAINKGNTSMIQAIQDTISKQRQERDNAKTEEELAEKERRLQYLKQDTSGANALEILELEKELAEGREDYTDTLIDQKIEELQKQNDQAAEQRQKQIEVLTKQKEIYERSELLWKNVYNLISNGIDNNGIIIPGSNLEALLQNVVNKEGLSQIGTEDWWREMTESIKAGVAWLQIGQQLENLGVTSGSIEFINGDGKTLTGTVQGNGDVKVGNQTYKDVYRDATGNYRTLEKEQAETSDKNEKPEVEEPTFPYGKFSEVYSRELAKSHSGDDVKALQWALQQLNYLSSDYKIEGKFDDMTDKAVRAFQAAAGLNADGIVGKNTKEAFRLKKFKTGGVADFTGPAWLDGTKSRPEIILNQQDSRNFIQLKDILGSILKGNHYSSSSTENNGDTVYDIDINVEKLEREVDLDTISNYVERKITETARYRNNNTVKISR